MRVCGWSLPQPPLHDVAFIARTVSSPAVRPHRCCASPAVASGATGCLTSSHARHSLTSLSQESIWALAEELAIPVLGICYGFQEMSHKLGGRVDKAPQREFGHAVISRKAGVAPAPIGGSASAGAGAGAGAASAAAPATHADLLAGLPDSFKVGCGCCGCCFMVRCCRPVPSAGVDVSRRQDPRATTWPTRRGRDGQLRVCGSRRRRRPCAHVWPPVPPRGVAHSARQGHPAQLCRRHLRRLAGLVHGVVCRR